MAGVQAKPKQNNWDVVIAIVDSGGHTVMLQRLDGTQLASIRIAERKARSAVEFRRPTKALEDVIAGAGAGLRYFTVHGAKSGRGWRPDRIAQAGADAGSGDQSPLGRLPLNEYRHANFSLP